MGIVQKKIKNTTIPFFFTLILLCLFLVSSPSLSGAGDLNISEFLLSEGKIGSGFYYVSPLLCDALRLLNRIWYVNWWSIYSCFIVFSGLFAILWFLNKTFDRIDITARVVLSALFSLFFWELILRYDINFGQTATCAAVTGFILSFDAVLYSGRIKGKVFELICGFIFLVLSGLTRGAMIKLIVPFGLMLTVYLVLIPLPIQNIPQSLIKSVKDKFKLFVPVFCVILAIICCMVVERIYYNTNSDYRTWIKTNAAAGAICDYPDQYPDYDDNPEVYDQFGIKHSWLSMIHDFCYSDKNTFTTDSLSIMKAYKTSSEIKISDFFDMLKEHTLLWMVLLAIICILCYLYSIKELYLPFMGALFGFIICSLYCVYRGRIVWRVTNGYLLFGVLSMILMVSMTGEIKKKEATKLSINARINWIAALCLIMLVSFITVKDEKGHFSKPGAKVINENAAELLEHIDSNDGILYLYFDQIRFGGAYNLWKGHAPDYLDNYIPLTACFIYGCREKLESRGIYDVYTDLLTRPKIFLEYTSITLTTFYQYLCDFYNPYTSATLVENYKGNCYFRFSTQVQPTEEHPVETVSSVSPAGISELSGSAEELYFVECRMDQETIDEYSDYWINVTDNETGNLYSYGMTWEDGKVLGTIVRMGETWNPVNCRVSLLGKDPQGKIYMLDDITDVLESYVNETEI